MGLDNSGVAEGLLNAFKSQFRKHYYEDGGEYVEHMHALVHEGQDPDVMFITCMDSRVDPREMFTGAGESALGKMFSSKVIAALVPPYEDTRNKTPRSIAAGVEFAVSELKVKEIVVLGHTACGGIKALVDSVESDEIDDDAAKNDAVQWMDMAKDIVEQAKSRFETPPTGQALQDAVEREMVIWSLNNLKNYPAVKAGLENGTLSVHGWQFDMHNGHIVEYNQDTGEFSVVTDTVQAVEHGQGDGAVCSCHPSG